MKELLRGRFQASKWATATLLLSMVTTGFAQPATEATTTKPAVEKWFGTLDAGVAQLRLLAEITTAADGEQSGVLISVDQGNSKIPMDSVSTKDGALTFEIKKIEATFAGKPTGDGDKIAGKFTQMGVARDLTFRRSDGVPKQKLLAAWVGDLKAGPQTLRVQFREIETSDGESTVLFDSLTQRAAGMKASLKKDGNKVVAKVPVAQATFEGSLNQDKTQISGTWSQMGNEFELTLTKVDKAEEAPPRNRPQSPEGPFSYKTESVTFPSAAEGVELAGTLTYPSEGGPFACVVTVSGSGPQDRDENIFGHKPFAVIADHLAKQGIATLRYDDRGIGQSTGSFSKATTADFAQDAAGAIEYLHGREQVDKNRIGVIGHSEGGLIATMLAAERDDLAHVILMAGPGVSGEEVIYDQTKAIAQASQADDAYIAEQEALMKELVTLSKQGDFDGGDLESILKKYPTISGDEDNPTLKAQLSQFGTPWFRFFLEFDPGPVLAKSQCPVLSLLGEHDLQVTTQLNGSAIQAAIAESGQPKSKHVELAGLNHLFQPCETGSPAEYDAIEVTLDESLLKAVTEWIKSH